MFGINFGPSSGELGATSALNNESGFAGSVGEGLVGHSAQFVNSLLNGNEADISKLLAPQISDIAKRANEKTQTNSEFANRSGGVNASNQRTMDTARGDVNNMISSLTGNAIGQGMNAGRGLLGQSMSGYNDVFRNNLAMQDQRAMRWNDILDSIGQGIGAIGELPGMSSGAAQGFSAIGGAL